MADRKISDLPAITVLMNTDIKEVSSGGVSRKETRTQEVLYTAGNLTGTPYVVGDLLYASGTGALSSLSDVATGNALLSNGVGSPPLYGKVDLTTTVSGVLPIANGGTGVITGPVVTTWNGSTTPVNVTAGTNVSITGGVISSTPAASPITLTGDVTGTGTGTISTTLATVNSNVGTFGDASHVPQITVNAKGLDTAVTNVLITPAAIGSPTTTGTGATGTWGIDITGNAATANLASTVITNANLTGDITSIGNATTITTVNSNTGIFGDANHVGSFTVNGKGQITAASNVLITPASIGAPTTNGTGATGTWPISINGNSSTVTTNANLSGDVSSVGNTTSYNNIVPSSKGGTGVNNGSHTITTNGNVSLNSDFTTTGGGTIQFNAPISSNVTLPTSGTLVTTTGTGATGTWNINITGNAATATTASGITGGYVSSITGTANQINASASQGNITLSTPQNINTNSSPTFSSMILTNVGGTSLTAANITAGTGNSLNLSTTASLPVTITCGNSSVSGQFGGALSFSAGSGTGSGTAGGGAANFSGGSAVSLSGDGGPVTISGGTSVNGAGGNIILNAGTTLGSTQGKILLNTGIVNVNSLTASQFVATDSSKNLISVASPIKSDVQKSTTNSSLTTQTEILVAVSSFTNLTTVSNSGGYYILSITEQTNTRQLIIFFQLTATKYNIGYPNSSLSPFSVPNLVITQVSDTSNVINVTNINQYLTFLVRFRSTAPNMYTAVTVKMSGGLLYSSATLNYTCTSYAESFLQDNPTITQYVSGPYSNLHAVAPSIPYGLINTSYISQSNIIGANLYLYCVNFGSNNINMYTINTVTGLLTNNSPSTLSIGSSPRNIVVSKDGRYAYATNSVSTNIQMMLLDISTGLLTNNTTSTISAGTNPSYMVIYPAYQNYLYVTNRGSATVGGYSIDRSTGLLSALSPATTAVGTSPIGIAITNTASPNSTFMYVANNTSGTVSMFQVSPASGALTALSPATIARAGAYSVLIHPNGLFVYVSSDNSSQITVFSINTTTGQLTLVQNAASGNTTREMAITPNGAFLYALNNGANNIQEYSVSLSTGQLTSLGTVALTNPTSIKMSPNGLYVYVSSGTTNDVTAYSINQSTGLLTSLGSLAAGTNAFSVDIL